jgi:hypothetical protein
VNSGLAHFRMRFEQSELRFVRASVLPLISALVRKCFDAIGAGHRSRAREDNSFMINLNFEDVAGPPESPTGITRLRNNALSEAH